MQLVGCPPLSAGWRPRPFGTCTHQEAKSKVRRFIDAVRMPRSPPTHHHHLDPAKMPRENRSCWGCATLHSHCPCLLHSQQLQDSLCSAPALCLSPSILCTSEASSQCRESRLLLRGLWLGKKKPASVGGTACSWTEAGKLRTTGRTQASSSSFV